MAEKVLRKIVIHAFVEIDEGTEEEAAATMDTGARDALGHFPAGEVTGADVKTISKVTKEEFELHTDPDFLPKRDYEGAEES